MLNDLANVIDKIIYIGRIRIQVCFGFSAFAASINLHNESIIFISSLGIHWV